MSRAQDYAFDNFIKKFEKKDGRYTGVEIELPFINLRKKPVEVEMSQNLCRFMDKHFGFRATRALSTGEIYQMTHKIGDIFSYDTTINTIEFSMGKEESIVTLADRFYRYIDELLKFSLENGYEILGAGMNPYAEYVDNTPIKSIMGLAKTDYLMKYTGHHNGTIFHSYTAATQTHIEAKPDKLPKLINLFGDMLFIDAYLFANSRALPDSIINTCDVLKGKSVNTTCYRDVLWNNAQVPNTGIYEGNYESLEDIMKHIMGLKLFVVTDGKGGFKAINPIDFETYFNDKKHPRKDMTCFRSLESIAPSYFGTIEIRATCTQPLNEIFGPVAFYTGIKEKMDEMRRLLDTFFNNNNIHSSRKELRERTTHGEWITDECKERNFIKSVIELAYEGLKGRGKGEERLLWYLYESRDNISCPAIRTSINKEIKDDQQRGHA